MVTGVPNKECWTTNCWTGTGELGCISKGKHLLALEHPPALQWLCHLMGTWAVTGGGCLVEGLLFTDQRFKSLSVLVHSLNSNTESAHTPDARMTVWPVRTVDAYLAGWVRAVLQGCKWGASGLKNRVGAFNDKGLLGRWARWPLILENCVWCRVGEDL